MLKEKFIKILFLVLALSPADYTHAESRCVFYDRYKKTFVADPPGTCAFAVIAPQSKESEKIHSTSDLKSKVIGEIPRETFVYNCDDRRASDDRLSAAEISYGKGCDEIHFNGLSMDDASKCSKGWIRKSSIILISG